MSLKQLAAIAPFKLFVSSTFDPLLARAINDVRFDGLDYTQVVAYAPREKIHIPGRLGAVGSHCSCFICSARCLRWKAPTWSAKRTRSSSSTRCRFPPSCPTSRAP